MRARTTILSASLLTLLACEPDTSKPSATPEGATANAQTSGTAKTPAPPTKKDPPPSATQEIDALLDRAVAECKFSEEGALGACKDRRLKGTLTRAVSKHRLDALAPLASSLTSPDPKRKILAARLIGRFSTFHLVDAKSGKSELDPELTRLLIDFVSSADLKKDPSALHVVGTATLAGTLSGMDVNVLAMLSTLDPNKGPRYLATRAAAIERLMTFGELEHFDIIQRTAEDAKHPELQRAAFRAPRNMQRWTLESQDLLCPWLASKLPDMKGEWDAGPARSIVYGCLEVEKWHAPVLDEALTRVKKGTYAKPLSRVVPIMCNPSKGAGADPFKNNPTICAKVRGVLTAAATRSKVDSEERAFAASTLADIFPDAQTRTALIPLKSDRSSVVANAATSGVARIDGRLPK